MKDNDFVLFVTEMFETGQDALRVIEQVGEDDDQAPTTDAFSQLMKRVADMRSVCAAGCFEFPEYRVEIRGDRTRW